MEGKLEPYDPRARCPKCESSVVTTSHTGRGGAGLRGFAPSNAMRRHCTNCGFTWFEAPLDAPEA